MNAREIVLGTGIFVLFLMAPALAQEPAPKEEMEKSKIARYEKKSVSYFKTYYSVPMNNNEKNVIEPAIRKAVELGRFDYNQVLIEVDNINELAGLVAQYVDQIKVDRAKAQGREDYRFKDTLVTGADLERIINSAYIYVPSVDKFEMHRVTKDVHDKKTGKTEKKKYWVATVGASVTFYHIIPEYVEGQLDDVRLALLKTVEATTEMEKEITVLRPDPKAKWQAFEGAVNNQFVGVARKIQIEVRRIAQFKLSAQVASSTWNSIEFEFGKESDVSVDHGYKVFEEVEGKGKQYIGYVKVRKAGDESENEMSRAQKIIEKSKIEAGTELQEYPQLLVNAYFRTGALPLKFENIISVPEIEDSSLGFGLVGGLEYNLGRFVGFSEFWANVEGQIALGGNSLYYYGVEGGLVKKFYLRRLAFRLGARVGWSRLTWDLSDTWVGSEAIQDQIGVSGVSGLELVLSPAAALTAELGYRVYASGAEWEYEGATVLTLGDEEDVSASGLVLTVGIIGMF